MKIPREKILFTLSFAARLILGGVFMASGLIKLLEPAANFRANLYQYEIIPVMLVPFLAAVIPWMEWILGFFVLAGYGLRWSSLILGAFSLSLASVIALSGKLGLDASHTCGCFGESGPQLTYPQIFSLDLLNASLGFFLFTRKEAPFSLDQVLLSSNR